MQQAFPFKVYQQAVYVITTESDLPKLAESQSISVHESSGTMEPLAYPPFVIVSSSPFPVSSMPISESRVVMQTLSSVPVVLQSDLIPQYLELGDALSELTLLDEDSEWKIESDVYRVACYAATELMEHAYPAPKVFNHGPKSVVFNWTTDIGNVYLTISSNFISALVSTPKQIERRISFSAKQLANSFVFLPTIRSACLGESTVVVNSSASDSL